MAATSSANFTGETRCSASCFAMAAGSVVCGAAVVFENTGFRGAVNFTSASAFANGSFAPAISGEWNPHATGMRCARTLAP